MTEVVMSGLMVSISGIRGVVGDSLTPEVVVNYACAFGQWAGGGTVIVGRDTRMTGEMIQQWVTASLQSVGCDVMEVGICPTPTIQYVVERQKAAGGIAITASHNPIEWNALKLIAPDGLFLDEAQGREVIEKARVRSFAFKRWNEIGKRGFYPHAVRDHTEAILSLPFVDISALRKRAFRVVVDCVNGAGSVMIPGLLEQLGCQVIPLFSDPTGLFPRGAEPLPENLSRLCEVVVQEGADAGFAVDPDADRLAIVSEKGEPLGEEYTLVLAVKFILSRKKGPVVVNASTSLAIDRVAQEFGVPVHRTKVGEIHVAKRMREVEAVIGGEGNGGVILPDVHLGRDAPVGIALTLQHLLEWDGPLSELYRSLPQYTIVKRKLTFSDGDPQMILDRIRERYADQPVDTTDGVKILWGDSWVHLRKSNTEPLVRVIAEAPSQEEATRLCEEMIREVQAIGQELGWPV